jgi:hypothetical protein
VHRTSFIRAVDGLGNTWTAPEGHIIESFTPGRPWDALDP